MPGSGLRSAGEGGLIRVRWRAAARGPPLAPGFCSRRLTSDGRSFCRVRLRRARSGPRPRTTRGRQCPTLGCGPGTEHGGSHAVARAGPGPAREVGARVRGAWASTPGECGRWGTLGLSRTWTSRVGARGHVLVLAGCAHLCMCSGPCTWVRVCVCVCLCVCARVRVTVSREAELDECAARRKAEGKTALAP